MRDAWLEDLDLWDQINPKDMDNTTKPSPTMKAVVLLIGRARAESLRFALSPPRRPFTPGECRSGDSEFAIPARR